LWTIVAIIIAFPSYIICKVFTNWKTDRVVRHLIWIYGRVWLFIASLFIKIKVKFSDKDSISSPCIFVANHLSFFDVYFMAVLPLSNIVFTVREWPFRIFFYAPFMRLAGYLNVESLDKDNFIDRACNVLSERGTLFFFPEGHRSRDGKLRRFYSGAFKIAMKTNCPVVPICIVGTDNLLPPGHFYLKPATIKIRVLKPVYPSGFASHIDMRKYIKALMAKTIKEMRRNNV